MSHFLHQIYVEMIYVQSFMNMFMFCKEMPLVLLENILLFVKSKVHPKFL
jgi:hypothetical protein